MEGSATERVYCADCEGVKPLVHDTYSAERSQLMCSLKQKTVSLLPS